MEENASMLKRGKKYENLTKGCRTYEEWAAAIDSGGYGGDDYENYEELLIATIEEYYLYFFDGGGNYGDGISKGSFIWPTLSSSSVVTSEFGTRDLSIPGASQYHKGIDIGIYGNRTGAPIYAADGGIVESAGRNSTAGNYVRISHGNGVVTVYMHMQNNSIRVKKGQRVSQGQTIGRMGSTGVSSGPHLHFELSVNGTTIDPLRFLIRP